MATYKQKLPTVKHHAARDSEDSEQEWVMFNASNKPIERRLVNNVSDEEDWHVLSDSSPVEEGIPVFESNSEFACSDYDSEPYHVQDENARSVELFPEGQDNSPSFVRKMPSHDGTGNFLDTTLSDGSNQDSTTSIIDFNFARRRYESDQDNESLPSDLKGSVISDKKFQDTRHANAPIPIGKKSWIAKFRNVFRIEEEVASTINSQEQTIQASQASQQIYHKFAESASSAAKFELGDLGNTNPIKSLANVGNENANSTTYTTVTTQYVDTLPNQNSQMEKLHLPSSASSASSSTEKHASIVTRFNSRLIMQKDPMAVNFAPTISKDMINEMISAENINSVDHQNQRSQSDKNSLLSTVWTTFCRITNNIIVPDDTDSLPNDHPTNLTFASPNHNTHNTGLASIITGTGENYDTCYPPFGNHLTLSELCPPLHNYKSYYSSPTTPSTSSHSKRRNSATSSSNTARIFLTPASSSTSLKSFTSRAGSDCGLESGRGMRKTTLEAPLVL